MYLGPTTISLRCWAFLMVLIFLLCSGIFLSGRQILKDIGAWWRKFGWSGVLSGLILVSTISVISYKYEAIKSNFPWLISWQLKSYKWFSWGEKPVAKIVVPVEIDDATFYGYMHREGPYDETDRVALAKLVTVAADQGAAVIALDINLDRAASDEREDQEPNRQLKAAFQHAQDKRIPVILVFGFQANGRPIPSSFLESERLMTDEDWSNIPRAGFDHAPDDMRKVPLEVASSENNSVHFPSFALRTVDAYEEAEKYQTRTRNELAEVKGLKFVYTSYLNRCQFHPVSALEYLCPERENLNARSSCVDQYQNQYPDREPCATPIAGSVNTASSAADQGRPTNREPVSLSNKIVLIGGNRHASITDFEKSIDDHESPVGPLRGMYFHANYVEGVLDHRVLCTVPSGLAAFLDGGLALVVLLFFEHKAETMMGRLGVLFFLACAIAITLTVVSLCVSYVLDFVLPLVLLVLHPALEKYIKNIFSFFGAAREGMRKLPRVRGAAH